MNYGQKWYEHDSLVDVQWIGTFQVIEILVSLGPWMSTWSRRLCPLPSLLEHLSWTRNKLSMLFLSSLYVIVPHSHVIKVNTLMNLVMIEWWKAHFSKMLAKKENIDVKWEKLIHILTGTFIQLKQKELVLFYLPGWKVKSLNICLPWWWTIFKG